METGAKLRPRPASHQLRNADLPGIYISGLLPVPVLLLDNFPLPHLTPTPTCAVSRLKPKLTSDGTPDCLDEALTPLSCCLHLVIGATGRCTFDPPPNPPVLS